MLLFAERRRQSSTHDFLGEVASFGEVHVDFAKMELVRAGREVRPTATEFRLLAFLLQNPERVISRKELLDTVWSSKDNPATRTVDIHVSKLRQEVETDPAHPVHVRTVHCAGYRFVP
jgi:two-component system alkaline phosphatase synthesis response regulator PhoP